MSDGEILGVGVGVGVRTVTTGTIPPVRVSPLAPGTSPWLLHPRSSAPPKLTHLPPLHGCQVPPGPGPLPPLAPERVSPVHQIIECIRIRVDPVREAGPAVAGGYPIPPPARSCRI